jgi:hypothetical protein
MHTSGLKMEEVCPCEISVSALMSVRSYKPEDQNLMTAVKASKLISATKGLFKISAPWRYLVTYCDIEMGRVISRGKAWALLHIPDTHPLLHLSLVA